jgi:hypothetical protein
MNKAKKVYNLAFKYESEYGSCSQCTIRALQEVYNEENDDEFQALGSFTAGGGREGDGICGAYASGMFFIGTKYGRRFEDIGKDPKDFNASGKAKEQMILVKKLHDKFIRTYGTVLCHGIQRKLFGRPYYLVDKDDLKKFYEAGGHSWGCTSVCGNSAKWTYEIIEEKSEK